MTKTVVVRILSFKNRKEWYSTNLIRRIIRMTKLNIYIIVSCYNIFMQFFLCQIFLSLITHNWKKKFLNKFCIAQIHKRRLYHLCFCTISSLIWHTIHDDVEFIFQQDLNNRIAYLTHVMFSNVKLNTNKYLSILVSDKIWVFKFKSKDNTKMRDWRYTCQAPNE